MSAQVLPFFLILNADQLSSASNRAVWGKVDSQLTTLVSLLPNTKELQHENEELKVKLKQQEQLEARCRSQHDQLILSKVTSERDVDRAKLEMWERVSSTHISHDNLTFMKSLLEVLSNQECT